MRSIVVGVEDSVASERALDQSFLEAQSTHRSLHVLHAWSTAVWSVGVAGLAYEVPPLPINGKQFAVDLLDEVVAKGLGRRLSDSPLTFAADAVEDSPGHALVTAAKDAGLVVVGGRAMKAVKGAMLGSTTAYVLHHAHSPVMIVPEEVTVGQVRRVVVGVDGSPSSRSALLWGHDAARRHGCPLLAVHATSLPGRTSTPFVPELSAYEGEALAILEQEVAQILPDPGPVPVSCQLSHLSPARGLLEVATDGDYLVVGCRGRGGFASLVLGSVATQCAQHTSGVLVVVRADQERLEP